MRPEEQEVVGARPTQMAVRQVGFRGHPEASSECAVLWTDIHVARPLCSALANSTLPVNASR
jgi:hypothetical protein